MKKITVVTGGSSGLGLHIASKLALKGKHVLIIGRNQARLDEALDFLSANIEQASARGTVEAAALDICDPEAVEGFYKTMADRADYELEGLVNVAGLGLFGNADQATPEMIATLIDTNLKGLIYMTAPALAAMKNQGGRIVNISSTSGIKARANETVYCASKWGVRGYTEALKVEYKDSGILVYGAYPGGMDTPFWNVEPDRVTTNFMAPEAVAEQIVESVWHETLYVSDIVIERK